MEINEEKIREALVKQLGDNEVSEVSGGTHQEIKCTGDELERFFGDTDKLLDGAVEFGMPKDSTKPSMKIVLDDEKDGENATVKVSIAFKCPKDKLSKDSVFSAAKKN